MSKDPSQQTPASAALPTSGLVKRVARLEELGDLIRAKRTKERLTLAQAAAQVGISAATLSRWERQGERPPPSDKPPAAAMPKAPDMRTLSAITRWLGVSLEEVLSETPQDPLDVLDLHFRADPKLDPVVATQLGKMFRALYEQAIQQSMEQEGDAHESDS